MTCANRLYANAIKRRRRVGNGIRPSVWRRFIRRTDSTQKKLHEDGDKGGNYINYVCMVWCAEQSVRFWCILTMRKGEESRRKDNTPMKHKTLHFQVRKGLYFALQTHSGNPEFSPTLSRALERREEWREWAILFPQSRKNNELDLVVNDEKGEEQSYCGVVRFIEWPVKRRRELRWFEMHDIFSLSMHEFPIQKSQNESQIGISYIPVSSCMNSRQLSQPHYTLNFTAETFEIWCAISAWRN